MLTGVVEEVRAADEGVDRGVGDDVGALVLLEVRERSLGEVEHVVLQGERGVSGRNSRRKGDAQGRTMLTWNVSSHCFESSVKMSWFSSC